MQQLLKALTVFGCINHVRRGADDRHAVGFEVERQLQRRLATVLNDDTKRFFFVDNFEHVFQCQRLKVQAIRSVVVGRNRLWIAVDHDGLVAVFAHGHGRVDAAIVKLDALADAVGTAAQHHDLLFVSRRGFALAAGVERVCRLVSRVQVGGVGFELCRAGVDPLVNRAHAQRNALLANGGIGGLELPC